MQFWLQSMGGHSNWMLVPEFDFLIDAGEGVASTIGIGRLNACRNIFLTHGHWDHAAGLIQALNLRRRQAEDGTLTVWHPPGPKFDAIRRLVGGGVGWEVYSEGQKIDVAKNVYISPFAVDHRGAAAFGFHCKERRTRRKVEFSGLGTEEISAIVAEARRRGEKPPSISEPYDAHLFAYTGDTEPLGRGRLGRPEILFHDATYLPGMETEAVECGHSCLSHALAAKEECGAGVLVALHVSPRHLSEMPSHGKDVLIPVPRLGCLRFEASGSGYQLGDGARALGTTGIGMGRTEGSSVGRGGRAGRAGAARAHHDSRVRLARGGAGG